MRSIIENGRNIALMQAVITFFAIAFAHKILAFAHMSYNQISMFHFAVFGSYFHVLALFELIVLSYFEFRRAALWIQAAFFVSNAIFTYISLKAGFAYYGYGYFLSSLLTFVLATAALHHYVKDLPYFEFIANNILHKRAEME